MRTARYWVLPILILILAGFFLQAGIVLTQSVHAADQDFTRIDAYIEARLKEYRIPGLALAVVQDAGNGPAVSYLGGYGIADPSGTPVTPETSFITGSTGKSITATAVMMLVDEGKIDLDAPVRTYLRWFSLINEPADRPITVRMLLNHTSGIPAATGVQFQVKTDVSTHALEDQVRTFTMATVSHTPGTAYEYANANYQVAGLIVEKVSGKTFQSFIQERIYTPLEMSHSFTSRDEARQNGMAAGYRYWFGYPFQDYNLPYTYRQFPAGWYICSAEDLANYLILHMNNGEFNGQQLVSEQSMTELHKPVLNQYAMGWVVDGSILSHNGGVPDYGSAFWIDTDHKIGVVLLFNVNTGVYDERLYTLAPNILRILTGQELLVPQASRDYRIRLIALIAAMIIELGWIILSSIQMKSWQRNPDTRPHDPMAVANNFMLPLLIELGMVVYLVSNLQQNGATIKTSSIYQPDLSLLVMVLALSIMIWGILRTTINLKLSRDYKPSYSAPRLVN